MRFVGGGSIAVGVSVSDDDGTFDLTTFTITAPFLNHGAAPPVPEWTVDQVTGNAMTLSLTEEQSQLMLGTQTGNTWPYAVWADNDTDRYCVLHGNLVVSRP